MSDKERTAGPTLGPMPPHRPRRAPVTYCRAVVEDLCARIARGERWSRIASTDNMPSLKMPYDWAKKYPAFHEAWTLAKKAGADSRADMVLDVAEASTPETLSVDRAHINALKWHVERDDKTLAVRDEPDRGANRRLIIEVRQFERYIDEDGVAKVRELLPAKRGRRK